MTTTISFRNPLNRQELISTEIEVLTGEFLKAACEWLMDLTWNNLESNDEILTFSAEAVTRQICRSWDAGITSPQHTLNDFKATVSS